MTIKDNSNNDLKYDIVVKIHLDYNERVVEWLKEKGHDYELIEILDLTPYQSEEEINDESPFIPIEEGIYNKLNRLSEITKIPIKDIVSVELGDFFNSVGDIPVIFLHRHLGIKNIKKPIEMLEKMDGVINIVPEYLEDLKTKDLVKHVENWLNSFKIKN